MKFIIHAATLAALVATISAAPVAQDAAAAPTIVAQPDPDFISAPAPAAASDSPSPVRRQASGGVDPALVPEFGVTAGVDPVDGTCQGIDNKRIPCDCPPDRDAFISRLSQFVAAGNAFGVALSFPTDNSTASQFTRIEAAIITLQNFDDTTAGVGCPAVSTTFVAQQAAL